MARLKQEKKMTERSKNAITTWLLRIIIVVAIFALIFSQTRYLSVYDTVYSITKLPKSFVGYRIIHISDMNNSTVDVTAKVNGLQPNVIVMSGGYSDENGNSDNTVRQVEKLAEIAPVYYVLNAEDLELGSDPLIGIQNVYNISETSIDLYPEQLEFEDFIKKNYGDEILTNLTKEESAKAADPDNEDLSTKYIDYCNYVKEELANTANAKIRLSGAQGFTAENIEELKNHANKITEQGKADYDIMLLGNLDAVEGIRNTRLSAVFTGGTYGTNYKSEKYTKGQYVLNKTQLFVSGGVGGHSGVRRIFNFPQIQCFTLSDGTLHSINPLERALGKVMGDPGTIFDNDGGFKETKIEFGKNK